MDTPSKIAEQIEIALELGQYGRARSTLEQGIATLAQEQKKRVDPVEDPTPIAELGLEYRPLMALERHGITTIGQLRLASRRGKIGLITEIGAKSITEIHEALVRYTPRRNRYRHDS